MRNNSYDKDTYIINYKYPMTKSKKLFLVNDLIQCSTI